MKTRPSKNERETKTRPRLVRIKKHDKTKKNSLKNIVKFIQTVKIGMCTLK